MTFKNESPYDFSLASVREKCRVALEALDSTLKSKPILVRPIINGGEITTDQSYLRPDPSNFADQVSQVCMANESIARSAVECASRSLESWRTLAATQRIQIIKSAAEIMRERREKLFALIVKEAGKTWKESDLDVCEAIDFLSYYAEQAEELFIPYKTDEVPGEDSFLSYRGRGVAVVISPWNFPLGITCGMSAAALVTGNTVIIKPSRQTSAIAMELCKIYLDAGVPPEAISFLPGPGSLVGRLLVEDPKISLYAFTGSKEVGLDIIQRAASVPQGQTHIKRVIAELGGKNAIIVDDDADLDEAVKGIVYSAFGYAGQKCSACSRLIAVGSIYEPLLERLKLAIEDIISGPAMEASSFLGPVIDQDSQRRIQKVIEDASKDLRLLAKGSVPTNGYFISPTAFRDVPTSHMIWREEIFGPVLACAKAENFEEAIKILNDSQYALTAGVFSRSPANILLAKEKIEVGNLYINRGCTGAVVKRHPFGGFKLSGIGSKAGGKDYLRQFVEPRLICENTMRRGFAPE